MNKAKINRARVFWLASPSMDGRAGLCESGAERAHSKTSRYSRGAGRENRSAAFARIDLIFVVLTVGVLLGLCAPALARNEVGFRSIECLANKKRLMNAWAAFAADNDGLMPGMVGGAQPSTGPHQPWTSGWQGWDTHPDNTNTIYQTDRRYSSLAPFLGGNTTAFRCPADTYVSAAQVARGWKGRARSVSGNAAVGPGEFAGLLDTYYRVRTTVAQFAAQSPAHIWVYSDEHPDSINDPVMYPPSATQWLDLPASLHDRGCAFAFADGRSEVHQWVSPRTAVPVRFIFSSPIVDPQGRLDVAWVRTRTPHD